MRAGPRAEDERGAVAVVVALLMVPMIGFAAISIDVAGMWAERQQLQTGADAGALAVAADCAVGRCDSAAGAAQGLAEANVDQGGASAQVALQGSDAVTVTTSGVKQHVFAPVLGIRSSTLVARSSAGWGAPDAGTARLPLVLSWCDFSDQTGGGLPSGQATRTITWAAAGADSSTTAPSTAPDQTAPDQTGTAQSAPDQGAATTTGTTTTGTTTTGTTTTGPGQDATAATTCAGPGGGTVARGSGWLAGGSDGCRAASAIGDAGTLAAAAVPGGCSASALGALQGQTLLLPVSDAAAAGRYRVHGYAAFTLTGYHFDDEHDWGSPCGGEDRCVQGYFTRHVDLSHAFTYSDAAPQLGAAVVALTQ